jgi:hypothetical protein
MLILGHAQINIHQQPNESQKQDSTTRHRHFMVPNLFLQKFFIIALTLKFT